ncbi:unnamed protein product [Microthlaspi erraticum]|uniref:Uncharacterized protein n=1 Tax=Microthlaspi erraticum TaxID=1685480 RepID=A0A6D2KJM2_9BRAS|nr:unnamed protein product [Microthlaspi erraticum]
MDHVLGKGEKKEVTFRQLGDLLGSLWRGNHGTQGRNSKGFGLQSLMEYSSSRSKAAQIRSPVLEISLSYKTAYNTRHQREGSLVLEGHHTYLCAAGVHWTREGLLQQVGWTSSFARPTSSLSTRSWMGGSNSSSPSIGWPSKLLLPNPELTTVLGGRTLTSDPLCTH